MAHLARGCSLLPHEQHQLGARWDVALLQRGWIVQHPPLVDQLHFAGQQSAYSRLQLLFQRPDSRGLGGLDAQVLAAVFHDHLHLEFQHPPPTLVRFDPLHGGRLF
jgi:hypothetical protein